MNCICNLKGMWYKVSLWISKDKSNFLRLYVDCSNLKNALANSDDPRDILLQRAVPRVETHLSDLNTQVSLLSNQVQALTSLVQGFQSFPADVFRQLEPFLSVNNQARLMMEHWNRVVTQGATLNVRINQPEANEESPSSSLFTETIQPSTQTPTPAPAPSPSSGEDGSSASVLPTQLSFSLPATAALASTSQPPASSTAVGTEGLALTIQAFKHAETLPALWRIWYDGLPGFHPVCELDRIYGVKNWRGSSGLSKFYQRRQKVIKRMEVFLSTANYNDSNRDEGIRLLEEKRTSNATGPMSIHNISEKLDVFFG